MKIWLPMITALWASAGLAENLSSHEIPMETQGSRTFYVQSTIQGSGDAMLLIDTGSGHSVINEETLASLMSSGDATFLKDLRGLMADGSTRIVPLYRISAITLGDGCVIKDVKAAVLPGGTRQILGISALQKAAPFALSFNPPLLHLSNCESSVAQSASEEIATPVEDITTITDDANQDTPERTQASAVAG